MKALDSVNVLLKTRDYDQSIHYLNKVLKRNDYNADEKNQLFFKLYLSHYRNKRRDLSYNTLLTAKRNFSKLSRQEKGKLLYYLAYINQVHTKKYDSVVFYSLKSLLFFNEGVNLEKEFVAKNYKVLSRVYAHLGPDSLEMFYLKKRLKLYLELDNKKEVAYSFNNIGTLFSATDSKYFNLDSSLYYYKKGIAYNLNNRITGSMLNNLGAMYQEHLKLNDSANYFYEKALTYKLSDRSLSALYFNKAIIAEEKKEFNNAIDLYTKASELAKKIDDLSTQLYVEENLSKLYATLKQYKKSLQHNILQGQLQDSIKNISLLRNIKEIEEKFDNEKLRADNLESEAKRKQNRNLLFGALVFIVLGTLISFLLLKNSKRKQQLAEQEKALETQKNLTLLKEQEINTINAMVEGQEKERKRVAEDLHDNLGSVLATLKLHFENLRINKKKQKVDQEVLFDKTENLIDEAYLKVRSIAHAKNAGVIANEGLLRAVQIMADKISSANKISIEVVHFGLDTPLENSLEIAVFRVIQELTTNILKHSRATNGTINLSRHENILNIIVEDDGIGFNTKKTDFRKGMGLHSIKTRVGHIQGELIIDSTMNKGTTIIINIPIE